ncbi:MAG: type II secretion system F family protein [Deferrisomatales bacterium]|nr:type II secretion system F family protein [Deferrisomatales bacterium]
MVRFLNELYRLLENADYVLVLAAVFASVALAVGALTFLWARRRVFRARFERFVRPEGGVAAPESRSRLLPEPGGQGGFVARVTAPLQAVAEPSGEVGRREVRTLLFQAGFRSQRAYRSFLALRGLCAGVSLFAYLVAAFAYRLSPQMLFVGLALAAAGYYLPLWGLRFLAGQRRARIGRGLPDALDLMVVCAEAGLGLDLILKKVGEEIRPVCPDLSDELFLTNLEIQAGKPREESFKNMALRTGVPEVNSLLAVLAQASRFGTSIAQTLRVHAEEMRIKRRQSAEERAATLAVKMIFPLAVFIFPSILIVLLGPAGIRIYRVLFPALAGGGG